MAKFKVGDRVRVIDAAGGVRNYSVGEVGVISEVYGSDKNLVRLDGKSGGMYDYRFELVSDAWEPKVGDRVRWLGVFDSVYYTTGSVYEITKKINDWSFGLTDDTVNKDTGSHQWNVSEVAKHFDLAPPVFTIEAGKFYRTRDGRKVGALRSSGNIFWPWKATIGLTAFYYKEDGYSCPGSADLHQDRDDLIAEWIDEPVVAASNDNRADAGGGFKVGDRLRLIDSPLVNMPLGTEVIAVARTGGVPSSVHFEQDGRTTWRPGEYFELVTPATPTPSNPAIVCLIENGQPKPSDRPYVHADEGAASTEASRLASVHKGKQFGVYVLTQTVSEEKVYAHEWQRLAIKGDKITAIKALKAANDLTLKGAKDAVEHWLATAA